MMQFVIVVTNEKISDARSMKSSSDESLQRSIASPSETPNIKTLKHLNAKSWTHTRKLEINMGGGVGVGVGVVVGWGGWVGWVGGWWWGWGGGGGGQQIKN
jgi:hypothetical protein